jgi:hypothetical protein
VCYAHTHVTCGTPYDDSPEGYGQILRYQVCHDVSTSPNATQVWVEPGFTLTGEVPKISSSLIAAAATPKGMELPDQIQAERDRVALANFFTTSMGKGKRAIEELPATDVSAGQRLLKKQKKKKAKRVNCNVGPRTKKADVSTPTGAPSVTTKTKKAAVKASTPSNDSTPSGARSIATDTTMAAVEEPTDGGSNGWANGSQMDGIGMKNTKPGCT